MKKKSMIAVLAVLVLISLVSGSLAVYQSTLPDMGGNAAAANFVIDGNSNGGLFTETLNIAPGDTQSSTIAVRNSKGSNVTETDMKLNINVTLETEVQPLVLNLKDGDTVLDTATYTSKTIAYDSVTAVFAANDATEKVYTIEIVWPEGDTASDLSYQGKDISYTISVTGTQVTGTTSNPTVND